MIKFPWQAGRRFLIGDGKRSPIFWFFMTSFLVVLGLTLAFFFAGKDQKSGGIPAEVLSKIHQEKASAQKDFADFIQTPAGKLWQKYPYWDPATCRKIAEGQISPGMSKEQAREAIGKLVEIRKKKGEKPSEEWVVESKGTEKMILKFEENALVSVKK